MSESDIYQSILLRVNPIQLKSVIVHQKHKQSFTKRYKINHPGLAKLSYIKYYRFIQPWFTDEEVLELLEKNGKNVHDELIELEEVRYLARYIESPEVSFNIAIRWNKTRVVQWLLENYEFNPKVGLVKAIVRYRAKSVKIILTARPDLKCFAAGYCLAEKNIYIGTVVAIAPGIELPKEMVKRLCGS